jgi:hypothetical protein
MRKAGSRKADNADVRSVQRMKLNSGIKTQGATELYFDWLGKLLPGIISVKSHVEHKYTIRFCGWKVLELVRDELNSDDKRQLYRITGGALCNLYGNGRIEFRSVLNDSYLIVGIHEYFPSLPWLVYITTQAPVHKFIMWRFRRHLESVCK